MSTRVVLDVIVWTDRLGPPAGAVDPPPRDELGLALVVCRRHGAALWRLPMEYMFSRVPTADIPRSSFNRTHGHKTTFDASYLVPFYVDEVLPGDTFAVNAHIFARLATPIVPIMDNMHMDTFYFFVPNRLVWANWQKFMGEQVQPTDSIDYTIPYVSSGTGFGHGSIYDYLGLPVGVANLKVNALPLRAYNLIWNEWFRDQNLQNSVPVPNNDGPDPSTYYYTLKRGKRHDYFTSCLPWPQKGPGVELPIGTQAPVIAVGDKRPVFQASPGVGNATALNFEATGSNNVDAKPLYALNEIGAGGDLQWFDTKLAADLSTATSVTINSLRQAFQIQKLLERDARGGTRYTELLRSHFGVVSPDARLQRPEYLGGASVPVIINPVVQNSGSPVDVSTGYTVTPQGNLAAYGTVGAKSSGFHKSFVEHGYIIGLVMVRADLNYQYGLHKMWSRETRYDFYWPAFAHLGEQAVLNREIYAVGAGTPPSGSVPGTGDYGIFGYQERWAEYRYFPNQITGLFRSSAPGSLDKWHLAQQFSTTPALNATFISDASDEVVDRVIAVPSEPQFLFDSHIAINCVRPMPTYSVPGYIDHF